MEVKEMNIADMTPAYYNPRQDLQPGDPEYEKLKRSLEEFGYVDPIIYNKRTGFIVGGHQRYKVMKDLGYKKIQVSVIDISEDKEKALNVALNKISGEFDMPLLKDVLEDIQKMDLDIELTGFDLEEIDDLLELENEEDEEAEEDDYDAEENLPEEPKAKPGDIYQLGNHRLMCGDSTAEEDIQTLIDNHHIAVMLTDPPYGINVVQNTKVGGGGSTKFGKVGGEGYVDSREYMPIKGDETTETAEASYNIASKYTDNSIIFGGNYFTDFLPPSRCWIVWDKENTGNFADVELAWTSYDKGAKLYRWLWNGLSRKGDRKTEGVSRVHPTQKPVGLIGNILTDFTNENDNVMDLFGGSGSTLIACEQLNRSCFMMEYEPAYIDVIIDRWEQYTGETAKKINTITTGKE